MADKKREAHPQHNEQEYLVAAIAGVGLTLLVIAGFAAASGLAEDIAGLELSNVALVGGALIFVAGAMWMAWLRPWTEFDDLTTAYYTGHHDHHDTHDVKKNDEFVTLPVADPAAAGVPEIHVAPVAAVEASGEVADLKFTEIQAEPSLSPDTPVDIVAEPPAAVETALAAPVDTEVQVYEAPPPPAVVDTPDDLKILEGIGPKTEQALFAEGITKFSQVAAMTGAELEQVVKGKHGVRIVGSTSTWPRQARIAASGDRAALDELKKRVRKGYLYDDFTDIEGIGPTIQEALYESGIRSYEDIAAASPERLKQVLNDPKLDPDSWPKQAQFLADGDLTGLQAYQNQLRGGRD